MQPAQIKLALALWPHRLRQSWLLCKNWIVDCFCQIHPPLLISDWCAKIYPHSYHDGWEQVIPETNMLDLIGNDNNVVSSVRVYPGCTLKLFNEHNNVGLLDSLTADVSFLSAYNDQVSSLSCTCQGMKCNDCTAFKQHRKLATILELATPCFM